jgi:hypothetical protein
MTTAALIVDKKGLAKKLAHKPKSFIVYELLQNAWDEDGVTEVLVGMEMLPGRPACRIFVEDDSPEGFQDLASVYTMFRASKKAPDPTKRGRFELGEKLVAAVALRMEVITTKGGIVIEGDKRTHHRNKLQKGSAILVDVRMTREEFTEVERQVRCLIPPEGISTKFNGEPLQAREPRSTFTTTLQTIRTDDEGNLKPTSRKTEVRVYEPLPGETPSIYEMGIPVVETGDRWHYDVQQRVPVNWERSNVPPAYLRTLRVEVLNALHREVPKDSADETWITEGLSDPRCNPDAAEDVKVKRFGEKAVIFSPDDLEANNRAVCKGYTVIPGGALPKGAWTNIRPSTPTAKQEFPTPKPYSEDGDPEVVIPEDEWTNDMMRLAVFSVELFEKLYQTRLDVKIVREPTVRWLANCGPSKRLALNYGKLGKRWFARPVRDVEVLDLLIHEFAHYRVANHLSDAYHKELTLLGAKVANLCLDEPVFFAT